MATYCLLRTLEAGLTDDREGICHFYSELEKVRGQNSIFPEKKKKCNNCKIYCIKDVLLLPKQAVHQGKVIHGDLQLPENFSEAWYSIKENYEVTGIKYHLISKESHI